MRLRYGGRRPQRHRSVEEAAAEHPDRSLTTARQFVEHGGIAWTHMAVSVGGDVCPFADAGNASSHRCGELDNERTGTAAQVGEEPSPFDPAQLQVVVQWIAAEEG